MLVAGSLQLGAFTEVGGGASCVVDGVGVTDGAAGGAGERNGQGG